jgi:hypothetical protein
MVATTFQPADWKRFTAALPIPLDAPVIKIVLFIRLNLLPALYTAGSELALAERANRQSKCAKGTEFK